MHKWFGVIRLSESEGPSDLPLLKDVVDYTWPGEVRRVVVKHLAKGKVQQSAGRPSISCQFCGEMVGDPTVWLTDGEWSWPISLVHLVEHHGVRVPADFESHILAAT